MKLTAIALAVVATLGLGAAMTGGNDNNLKVSSVEFIGMPAPSTDAERTAAYTTARVRVTYSDGGTTEGVLSFNRLFYNTDKVGGSYAAGQLYDANGAALLDVNGYPVIAETPDANSLMQVAGAPPTGLGGHPLYLVTQHEYDWLDSAGTDWYGKMPMTMSLATIDQNPLDGRLTAVKVGNIDMMAAQGLWIPCAGTLTPWNTHLGSEEYEPDARCIEAGDCASTGWLDLAAMNRWFGNTTTARPYHYGLTPEVTVKADGSTAVVKHRTLGRVSRELAEIMPDRRTVYQGDDGTYNVLTMFIADQPGNLSAGTLYAARWNQTGSANGGSASLGWVKLGSATNAELEMLANTLKFSDIFETATVTKNADGSYPPAPAGFTQIIAGHNAGTVENLRLKPGMEKAAAFLETRRYAAYLGATTEFEKFEGVAVNARDKRLYLAMTRMSNGMEDKPNDPANHIRVAKLLAGAVYEMALTGSQKDSANNPIASDYVGVTMAGLVLGQDIAKDAVGNTAHVDKIANPDNLKFSEKMRVLFIGEDSSTAHINNFLWAYHVDSGKLERILSLPAGAESTGLQAVDNLNGFSYIMSNFQHAGDFSSNIEAALKSRLAPLIDKSKAAVGYLGGIPRL